jgi:hypothetical protein
MMSGEGIAAVIGSLATLVVAAGNFALQWKQLTLSKSNTQKLDANSDKLDDVHAATASIAESTGTHKTLPP